MENILNRLRRAEINERVLVFFSESYSLFSVAVSSPYISGPLGLIVLILLGSWLTLLFYPLALIRFHEKFLASDNFFLQVLKIPLKPLISFFAFRPRVLDAWVTSNLDKARDCFSKKELVHERRILAPVKVTLNGQKNTNFDKENLRDLFAEAQSKLLIYGDGGAGKTSLACQIAKWAMQKKGLFETYSALPALIEDKFPDNTFQEAIARELKLLIKTAETTSPALLKELLIKKRILVIADGMSEMDEDSRAKIIKDADINAIVFTSRNKEIKNISKIETRYISHGDIYIFFEEYLNEKLKEENSSSNKMIFTSPEIYEYCAGLVELAGDKGITVLLAKLYIEQMIAQKQDDIEEGLAANIPELMCQSIKILYRKTLVEGLEFSDVLKAAKMIAWLSLKADYQPAAANKEVLRSLLLNIDKGNESLEYLERKLKIIETKGIEDDKVSFKMDPLAEYLAALYLVEENASIIKKWEEFIEDALSKDGSPASIKGFLLAVYDCCLIDHNKNIVPAFIIEKLRELTTSSDQ